MLLRIATQCRGSNFRPSRLRSLPQGAAEGKKGWCGGGGGSGNPGHTFCAPPSQESFWCHAVAGRVSWSCKHSLPGDHRPPPPPTQSCAAASQVGGSGTANRTWDPPLAFTSDTALCSSGFTRITVSKSSLLWWRVLWPVEIGVGVDIL